MTLITYIIFILGLIADVQTTRMVLLAGGREDNPIYGRHPSTLRLVLAHVVLLAGGVAIYVFAPEQVSALWIANIALIGVSIHNYLVWRKLKRA